MQQLLRAGIRSVPILGAALVLIPAMMSAAPSGASTAPLGGKTVYVSQAGDDAADGLAWTTAVKTIGKGVELAATGDTVLVSNGLYQIQAQLDLSGKGVSLRSVNGREVTEIKGDGKTRLLYLNHPLSSVEGFTFRNGKNAYEDGTAILLDSQGGTLRNCRVTGCFAGWTGTSGSCVRQRAGVVTSCLFDHNGSAPGQGSTILMEGGLLENSVVADNVMVQKGGGLYLKGGVARNCTISRNVSSNPGAGVCREGSGQLVNCIVWGNVDRNAPTSPSRDIHGATAETVVNCCYPGVVGTDIKTNSPAFVDPSRGDFRLRAGSSCIDGGQGFADLPGTDLGGGPRIIGTGVDIGAFERDTGTFACGFRATSRRSLAPLVSSLEPVVEGAASSAKELKLVWTLEPEGGTPQVIQATGLEELPISLPAGLYSVTLEVTDPATGRTTRENASRYLVSSPATIRVVSGNEGEAFPFDTWEKAASRLEEAVEFASDGTTVLVSNGLYAIERPLVLGRAITLEGTGGPAETIVDANGAKGLRLCVIDHPDACVKGLTFRGANINYGIHGSVMLTEKGGLLEHCRVTGNRSHSYDSDGAGVRLEGGRVNGCLIDRNKLGGDSMKGAGVFQTGGILENSLVISNETFSLRQNQGGGVALFGPGVVRNCTITRNSCGEGGGIMVRQSGLQGKIQNCIITGNTTGKDAGPGAPNWFCNANEKSKASLFQTNCTPQAVGVGCIVKEPMFLNEEAGDYSLAMGSPCVDAGALLEGLAKTDLLGNPRLVGEAPDLGALELKPLELDCGFSSDVTRSRAPAAVTFTAVAFGFDVAPEKLRYTWIFDDEAGAPIACVDGNPSVSHVYAAPGRYDVRLEIVDPSSGKFATFVQSAAVLVAPDEMFVNLSNSSPKAPFATPETASTNLAEVLDWAVDGCTVTVAAGTYDVPETISLDRAVVLRATSGFDKTTLKGRATAGVRVVDILHDDARVEGFTIRGGCSAYAAAGGGVHIERGELRRCLITDNQSGPFAKGTGLEIIGGLVSECVVSNNAAAEQGGGVYLAGGICQNSIITASRGKLGGGVYVEGGILRNCTIVGNTEIQDKKLNVGAGGVYSRNDKGTVENCIIWGNEALAQAPGVGAPDWGSDKTTALQGFRNTCTSVEVGTNCVVSDPLFKDNEAGDFRIRSNSPCRDKGIYGDWMATATDFWGNPRVDVLKRVDIGAYENPALARTLLLMR